LAIVRSWLAIIYSCLASVLFAWLFLSASRRSINCSIFVGWQYN
jgi:hypothetical protein